MRTVTNWELNASAQPGEAGPNPAFRFRIHVHPEPLTAGPAHDWPFGFIMKKPLEHWTDKIFDEEVVLRVYQMKDGFRVTCQRLGDQPTFRDYETRPTRVEVKADCTKHFITKRSKAVKGNARDQN